VPLFLRGENKVLARILGGLKPARSRP